MKTRYKSKSSLVAFAAAAFCTGGAIAADVAGLEIHGYSRGGPVFSADDNAKGHLSLGGDLQMYRLGNEGDNGFEFDLIKNFEADGLKWKLHYMPGKWGSGSISTEQAYVEMSGLSFDPNAKIWAGQRRLRIQDVHIVDNFLMNYGDNQGAGVVDMKLGNAKLGVGVFTSDKFDVAPIAGVKATRLNADISEININPGGKLRVLLTSVNGTGLAGTNHGSGISVSHNQENFIVKGMNNSLFVQSSSGHARIDGEFLGIDGVTAGQKVSRIADSLNWQNGAFGGQTMLGYQTTQDEVSKVKTKDTSIGGRISYAFTPNFKMLGEIGITSRNVEGQDKQTLNKITIAPTFSVGQDFWSRPELRIYLTKANWNDAATAANTKGFGAAGKTSTTMIGAQYEIWF